MIVGQEPAHDRVGEVERQRRAEERRLLQIRRDEAQAAQPREHRRQRHGAIDARRTGLLQSAGATGTDAEDHAILKRLYDFGEERLARLAEELLANPRFADAFSRALQSALETKGRVDRNMQTLLALLNLPSRTDVNRLLTKLDAIQGSLVNLNLKVDRLLAGQPARRRRAADKTQK